MPTYDFRCPNGHEFTHFYKTMSAAQSELPCPECGALAKRQMSAGAGLVFKGSGFYLTDYGKNAHRGTEKAAASSATEASSGSSGDKKPDAPASKAEKSGASSTAATAPKAESSKPASSRSDSPKGATKSAKRSRE